MSGGAIARRLLRDWVRADREVHFAHHELSELPSDTWSSLDATRRTPPERRSLI
jgi:hypothetical protein